MVTYPTDWKESSIGDLFNVSAGGDVKKQYFSKFRTSAYQYEIFSNGIENRGHYGYTSLAVFPGNSVTVTARGTIGQAFYREAPYDAIIRLLVLSPKSENIKPKFYEYYINNQIVFERENTGVPQLTAPKIKEKTVPFFDRKEQEKIIETLQVFDTYIDDLAELIEKKKGIRDGALEDLISGNTRIFPFNEELVGRKLGKIAFVQDGTHGTFKRTTTGFYLLSAKNVLTNQLNIGDDESRVSEEDYKKIVANGYPQKGDILLSCVGTIGRCCILEEENVAFQRSVAFIRTSINKKYLLYVLQSNTVQEQLKSMVNASAQGGIYLGALRKVELKITLDDQEQEAIAAVLTAMDEEIRDLETEREKMIQIREGAMDDLLTGRVRLTK